MPCRLSSRCRSGPRCPSGRADRRKEYAGPRTASIRTPTECKPRTLAGRWTLAYTSRLRVGKSFSQGSAPTHVTTRTYAWHAAGKPLSIRPSGGYMTISGKAVRPRTLDVIPSVPRLAGLRPPPVHILVIEDHDDTRDVPDSVCIAMSADGDPLRRNALEFAREAGARLALRKPIEPWVLLRTLDGVVAGRRSLTRLTATG